MLGERLAHIADRDAGATVLRFSTFRGGSLRTVGVGLALASSSLEAWSMADLLAIHNSSDWSRNAGGSCARGKVFLVGPSTRHPGINYVCYQVKAGGVAEAFCGNSTAAAIASLSRSMETSPISLHCIAEESRHLVRGSVRAAGARLAVQQAWELRSPYAIEHTSMLGRPAIRCKVLNDYYVVQGPVEALSEDIAVYASERLNLNEKIVVLDNESNPPKASFFNCNGLHGAAPHTGLATLALVARQVPWVRDVVYGGLVQTPSSVEEVPLAVEGHQTMSLQFPEVEVELAAFGVDACEGAEHDDG